MEDSTQCTFIHHRLTLAIVAKDLEIFCLTLLCPFLCNRVKVRILDEEALENEFEDDDEDFDDDDIDVSEEDDDDETEEIYGEDED